MQPWYKVVTLRQEVREGRSFSPDEFAIALEQVVAGTAPLDYRDPSQFFSRTCFTRALEDHVGMVLRRLAGGTQNTSPVLTLVTQFGGGKTHTLTALYHLASAGARAGALPGVSGLLAAAGLPEAPDTRVGVFVGNAWDPSEGRETPWIDLARQLAGDKGVAALGSAAATTPPGTEAIARVFAAAEAPVLLLFDEVLNFVNRHRDRAESFHAFIQNLTVAVTGTAGAAAVISLPRSQVEMTDWDRQWQDRITKVVRRVARDLIANDEAEIGEVVRRAALRGSRRRASPQPNLEGLCGLVLRAHRPPSPRMDDGGQRDDGGEGARTSESPFRSVLPLPSLDTLRLPAQVERARPVPADPRHPRDAGAMGIVGGAPAFPAGADGSPDHPRLGAAGRPRVPRRRARTTGRAAARRGHRRRSRGSHRARRGAGCRYQGAAPRYPSPRGHGHPLRILRRAGGQGRPPARAALCPRRTGCRDHERRQCRGGTRGARVLRPQGRNGRLSHPSPGHPEEGRERPARGARRGDGGPACHSQAGRGGVQAWRQPSHRPLPGRRCDHSGHAPPRAGDRRPGGGMAVRRAERRANRAMDARARDISEALSRVLVWCARKPGRELRDRVELWLAWERVSREVAEGVLGTEFDRADHNELRSKVKDAETAARDEVWGGYRFVALSDARADSGLKSIDLGAGHSSASETLCGRVITALRSEALLSESVGAGYLDRHWPPAFKETGAWPLTGLRQSFLNGSLTRLIDPDAVLRRKIVEFVESGVFGLASGATPDGRYERLWYAEPVGAEEVAFESGVFLLTKARSEALRAAVPPESAPAPLPGRDPAAPPAPSPGAGRPPEPRTDSSATPARLCVSGTIPPELWNRLGTKVIPKLRAGTRLTVGVEFSVDIPESVAGSLEADLRQVLAELDLETGVKVGRRTPES